MRNRGAANQHGNLPFLNVDAYRLSLPNLSRYCDGGRSNDGFQITWRLKGVRAYILFFLFFPLAAAANDRAEEQRYYQMVYNEFRQNCTGANLRRNGYTRIDDCRADYSPRRCAGLAHVDDWQPWRQCVRSCAHASVWSRTFGDCSR